MDQPAVERSIRIRRKRLKPGNGYVSNAVRPSRVEENTNKETIVRHGQPQDLLRPSSPSPHLQLQTSHEETFEHLSEPPWTVFNLRSQSDKDMDAMTASVDRFDSMNPSTASTTIPSLFDDDFNSMPLYGGLGRLSISPNIMSNIEFSHMSRDGDGDWLLDDRTIYISDEEDLFLNKSDGDSFGHPTTPADTGFFPSKDLAGDRSSSLVVSGRPTARSAESSFMSQPLEGSPVRQPPSPNSITEWLRGIKGSEEFLTGQILMSNRSTWCFPSLPQSRLLSILSAHGFVTVPVNHPSSSSVPGKGSYQSRNQGGKGNTCGKPTSRTTRSTTSKQSGKAGVSKANQGAKLGQRPVRFFACPMSKHNPERYASVYNPCTIPPGMPEYKRVKEHLQRYHSKRQRCPYCHQPWSNADSFETEFSNHILICSAMTSSGLMSLPEHLTPLQEDVLRQDSRRGLPSDRAWISLYQDFFPSEYPIPSPYYDYFVARYSITTPAQNNFMESPVEFDSFSLTASNGWTLLSPAQERNGEAVISNMHVPGDASDAISSSTAYNQQQSVEPIVPSELFAVDTAAPTPFPAGTTQFAGPSEDLISFSAQDSSAQTFSQYSLFHAMRPRDHEGAGPSGSVNPPAQHHQTQAAEPLIVGLSQVRDSGYHSGSDRSSRIANDQVNSSLPSHLHDTEFPMIDQGYITTEPLVEATTAASEMNPTADQNTHRLLQSPNSQIPPPPWMTSNIPRGEHYSINSSSGQQPSNNLGASNFPERIMEGDQTVVIPSAGMPSEDMFSCWLSEEILASGNPAASSGQSKEK